MAKIAFNIKFRPQIESGEYKVETFSGYPVTIYRWDFNDGEQTSIMGSYVFEDGKEYVGAWNEEGHFDLMSPNDLDLFVIAPEPELSEFEKELSRCLCDSNVRPEEEDYDKWAKEYAPALLAIARKELCEQVVDHTKEAFENGKAEALKDLPRWRKVKGARGYNYSQETKFSINGRYLEMNDTLNNIYEISFEELEKLSRL